jgi:rhamnose utilization protein RhaD (predicted bifunctional aldolase and dehydrogenase)/NAD(P)-dependent dehydrogenase (short-subunit alcohol dehydrogenase family)
MRDRWSDHEAAAFVDRYAGLWGERLALRTYSARLLGSDSSLVLHGGGNTSVKDTAMDVFGRAVPALYVKASGRDMATIEPEGQPPLDLESLRRLRALADLGDDEMVNQLRLHLFRHDSPTPSIETLVHAFLPPRFIDHSHADAILALSNQEDGHDLIREALGDDVVVVDYVKPGFALATRAAAAFDARPDGRAMVWMHHGLVTWGDSARESYTRTIDLASRAEAFIAAKACRSFHVLSSTPVEVALSRLSIAAPIVRGLLAGPSTENDASRTRVIVQPLVSAEVLDLVASEHARDLLVTPPLTSDHLIRTKTLPAWIADPAYDDPDRLKAQLAAMVLAYADSYRQYLDRHQAAMPAGLERFDPRPQVILMPGLGALCAGRDVSASTIARDITAHTLAAKAAIGRMGKYRGLSEEHLVAMEYQVQQHAKLSASRRSLDGRVALVTGAAGAIGSGVSLALLEQGCHVALTDLPGAALDGLADELRTMFGAHVIAVPLDVTDAASVRAGFNTVASAWGGIDLLVVNAGIALVSSLATMALEAFRKLERVNIEGTLLLLAEASRHFTLQGSGGDIVLVSTKNVFAPGAKFGAYSATKAASHQLGRIASLEMADLDVRVNMVSPDAVFGQGDRKSGLWREVGPDRMRARGLDEAGLEDYYRNRNLLKARVTAQHVANGVLFFATRQTPTTGATIPVDGGLPDATPR